MKTCFKVLLSLLLLLALLVFGASPVQATSIASLELGTASQSGNTTGAATFTSKDASITTLPALSLTAGQQGQAGGTGYVSSKAWNVTSEDLTKYWEFTLTAASGLNISVTSVTLRMRRAGTGPPSINLRSSVDSYGADIGGTQNLSSADTYTTIAFTGLTLSGSSITFRVYGWGATGSGGTLRIGDGADSSLDIDVQGTTTMSAPAVISPPASQTATPGDTAAFAVVASGLPSLAYQWAFNGTNILGATDSSYTVTNVQYANAGTYAVFVSNPNGSTNAQAMLQVLPPGGPSIRLNGQLAVGTVPVVASAQLTISGGFTNGFIFYTLDGSVPTTSSPLYTGPITLTSSATIEAMSLSADFQQTAVSPAVTLQIIPVYNLQTSVVGAGTISANPSNGPYPSNSVVVLTATAAPHWAFDHWTGDVTGSENPASVTMNGPRSVQAVFVQTDYPLTATTAGGGSVTVNGEVISPATFYPIGTVVTLSATASDGWSFLGWQGDASGTNNSLSVTMNQPNNIQAIFATVVGTNTAGGGGIVLNQPNPVPYGATITASAVPHDGNYFVAWSGAASGTNSPTGVTVTTATPTVSALFSALPGGNYSLALVVMGSGSVAISPQQNYYNPGDSVTLSASTTNAGTRFYGWTGDASGTNNPLVVVVSTNKIVQANFGALPTVNVSPQNLIVLAGSNGVLHANAAGIPPLSYQWLKGSGPIDGATNVTYVITNAQPADEGNYSVIVSNLHGSATSGVATVTVVFPPSITVPPQSQNVVAGTSVTLSVLASGTAPLSYEWLNSLGPIAGATSASYTLNPAQTNDSDGYYLVVTNLYGVVTSEVATVFVYVPVSISVPPASQAVSAGVTALFSVVAGGYPAPSYQWTFHGTNLAGATTSRLTIPKVRLSDCGDYVVWVGNGFPSDLSAAATLSMLPSITAPYIGATAIWGRSATLTVGAIGTGDLGYQWFKDGVAIESATNRTFNLPTVQLGDGGFYSVVVSSSLGSVTNTPAQLIVNPADVDLGLYAGMTINGAAGYRYEIQYTLDLTVTNAWVTLTNLTLQEPVELWVDTTTNAAATHRRFYRILPGQ
jgi:hypothetical protein